MLPPSLMVFFSIFIPFGKDRSGSGPTQTLIRGRCVSSKWVLVFKLKEQLPHVWEESTIPCWPFKRQRFVCNILFYFYFCLHWGLADGLLLLVIFPFVNISKWTASASSVITKPNTPQQFSGQNLSREWIRCFGQSVLHSTVVRRPKSNLFNH